MVSNPNGNYFEDDTEGGDATIALWEGGGGLRLNVSSHSEWVSTDVALSKDLALRLAQALNAFYDFGEDALADPEV